MYSVNFDISGQVAVITGAGGVICGTVAKEMAKKGVKVVLLDLFLESAQRITDEIIAEGGDAIAIKTDVLDRESLEAARDQVMAKYGKIDILINGAGGNKPQATISKDIDFFHLDLNAFKWVFDLNVTGAVLTTMVFGGTSLIIVVSVALETSRQLESEIMMRHYKGFLD
jgi:NAD(P)-dependent dehydrogenase (short-subunit alcohol dehydrogenase family)